jgi:hypothetical protein
MSMERNDEHATMMRMQRNDEQWQQHQPHQHPASSMANAVTERQWAMLSLWYMWSLGDLMRRRVVSGSDEAVSMTHCEIQV